MDRTMVVGRSGTLEARTVLHAAAKSAAQPQFNAMFEEMRAVDATTSHSSSTSIPMTSVGGGGGGGSHQQ
ncbi:hypothetical protein TYRP_015189 [Tyrophagus putrescentiae]|nr:hypothetical protein TYRP_015189 [Tyrophagus putrescentiae]